MYSFKYNVFPECLVVVSCLIVLDFKLKPLIAADKRLPEFKALYGHHGDVVCLLRVWYRFLDTFSKATINRRNATTVIMTLATKQFKKYLAIYTTTPTKLDPPILKTFRAMDNNHKLHSETAELEFYTECIGIHGYIMNKLIDKQLFKDWCGDNYVSEPIFYNILVTIMRNISLHCSVNAATDPLKPSESFNNLDNSTTSLPYVFRSTMPGIDGVYENVTHCFIHGYSKNLVFNNGNLYNVNNITAINYIANDTTTLTSIAQWNPKTKTPCTVIEPSRWLMFLSPMIEPDIQFLMNVSLMDVLKRTPHLYANLGINLIRDSSSVVISVVCNEIKNKVPPPSRLPRRGC